MILMNRASTFKIITSGSRTGGWCCFTVGYRFYCPGYKVVEDRRIHCAKRTGHGSQNFVEGAQNSCNPVFIEVGLRLGVERYYKYFRQFGLLDKNRDRSSGRGRNYYASEEKYGRSGTGNGFFWTVFSDYACSAGCNSKFTYKRRQTGDTAFLESQC